MASTQSESRKRSPLAPIENNANTTLAKVKQEVISPSVSSLPQDGIGFKSHSESGVVRNAESTPKRNIQQGCAPSPPIFSMDALTDVLGDLVEDDGSDEGQDSNDVEKKFCLDDMSTIEQDADTVATVLFNATQNKAHSHADLHHHQKLNKNKNCNTDLHGGENFVSLTDFASPLSPVRATTSLPQLEHPLLETLLSPATSSRCTSPVYTLVRECFENKHHDEKNDTSSESNVGSNCCSDSDFELDGGSSASSDDSSDSDFNVDDSDSEYGNKRKRNNGSRKQHRQPAIKPYGATRKQPYYHHKSTKSKEQVVLLLGEDKPCAVRQISTHQLEAIAATMGSSPVTVNWLLQNYETSEGNSLPRALMYGHYLRHCAELRLDPVNAASFGKLIRSVFVGLTTRRLGTRGNSKYHYCGIRIKDSSMLLLEDPDLSKKTRTNGKRSKKTQILAMQGVGICGLGGNKGLTLELDSGGKIDFNSVKKYLGIRTSSFPEISVSELYILDGVTGQDLTYFIKIYEQHCVKILEAAEKFNLCELGTIWENFYQLDGTNNGSFAKDSLLLLTRNAEVQFSVENIDAYTYDQLLSILMPNVIAQLPFQLLEEYHKFILLLHPWLVHALASYDASFIQQKLMLLDAFINEFKAWISLNLSAQAARDSMQSPNSIAQLLSDLNRINFRGVLMDVKEYVNVDEMDINVHESLKRILSGPDSIEPWSIWLVGLVEQRLGKSHTINDAEDGDCTFNAIIQECRDLSLRWLKYMSQLKLELLLRSSGSLATFLSLELLFSNFLLHLIKVYKSRALAIPLVMYNMARKASMNATENEAGENSGGGGGIRSETEENEYNQGTTGKNKLSTGKPGNIDEVVANSNEIDNIVKQEVFDEEEIRAIEKSQ